MGYNPGPSVDPATILLLIGIWSLVGLLIYVWLLWALGRLFPHLGLPAAHGWIPVYNQWRLIERGGYPGWLVLLAFVGFSIVPFIVTIMAIHRINQEKGEGAGMTVLGAFILPLWATLLGSRLIARGPGASGPGMPGMSAAPGYPPAPGYPAGAGFQGAPVATANTGLVEYGPNGQVFPVLDGQAPAPAPQQGAAYGLPPVPPLPPLPAAPLPVAPQAAQAMPPILPTQPTQPVAQDSPLWAPEPAPTSAPAANPAGANPWSLGNTVDNNFERLANEALPQRDAQFGGGADARPFSWPEPQPPVAEAPQSLQTPAVPAMPPAPPAPPSPPTFAPPAPAPGAPAPASVSAPTPTTSDPVSEVSAELVDPHPATDSEPEEGFTATVVTGSPAAPPAADEADDELDHTIVVSRRADWVLELPDGSLLELQDDDIVLGRRPTAIDGSAVLTVPDSTRTLSKSHARLRRSGETWTIEDLNSTNGVFVFDENGAQIELEPGTPQEATEQLIIGTLEVRLRSKQ